MKKTTKKPIIEESEIDPQGTISSLKYDKGHVEITFTSILLVLVAGLLVGMFISQAESVKTLLESCNI